jgi:hypothetical protein
MTKLPATFAEAETGEMVDIVSQWVEVVLNKMSAEDPREWLEATLRDFLQRDLIDRLKVIASADAGDEIADAALGYVFHSMMARGEKPPASMVAYEARARLRGPNKRSVGRNAWYDNWRRDIGIAVLVFLTIERFELNPTRHQPPKPKARPSACSIVTVALGRVRINVEERRVQNIWGGLAGQVTAYAISKKMFTSMPST